MEMEQSWDRYAALLDDWLDDALPAEESAGVEAHLCECERCLSYVEDALAIRSAMRRSFSEERSAGVPAGFAESVLSKLDEAERDPLYARTAPVYSGERRPLLRGWRRAVLPLAACLALAAVVHGTGILRPFSKSAPEAQMVTESAPQAEAAEVPAAAAPSYAAAGAAAEDEAVPEMKEEPLAQSDMLVKAEEAAPAAAKAAPSEANSQDAGERPSYDVICTIPASRAEGLLDEFAPVSTTSREIRYEVPVSVFRMWQTQGALDDMDAEISETEGASEDGTALIVIRK